MMRKALVLILLLPAAAGCTHVAADGTFQRWPLGRAAWSVVIPGVGQVMNNQHGKGALMLGLSALNTVTAFERVKQPDDTYRYEYVSDDARVRSAIVSLGLSTWSGIDAYRVAKKQNVEIPVHFGGVSPEVIERLPSWYSDVTAAPAERATPVVLVIDPFGLVGPATSSGGPLRQVSTTLVCRF